MGQFVHSVIHSFIFSHNILNRMPRNDCVTEVIMCRKDTYFRTTKMNLSNDHTAFLWKIRQTVEKNFKRKKIRIYMQFVT